MDVGEGINHEIIFLSALHNSLPNKQRRESKKEREKPTNQPEEREARERNLERENVVANVC